MCQASDFPDSVVDPASSLLKALYNRPAGSAVNSLKYRVFRKIYVLHYPLQPIPRLHIAARDIKALRFFIDFSNNK